LREVYIYVLIDPETDEKRYVGKTVALRKRYGRHFAGGNSEKLTWLQSLKARGLLPIMQVLETTTNVAWPDRERWWIAEGKRLGWPLLNADSGGWGGPDPKPTTREKMRKAKLGRPLPESAKAKLSQYWTGRKRPGVSEKLRKRPHTWGSKISASKMGHSVSDESKEKMRRKRLEYFNRKGRAADKVLDYLFQHPEDVNLSCRHIAKSLKTSPKQVANAKRLLGLDVRNRKPRKSQSHLGVK